MEVDPRVYANVEKFRRIDTNGKKKGPGDQLFGECPAGPYPGLSPCWACSKGCVLASGT